MNLGESKTPVICYHDIYSSFVARVMQEVQYNVWCVVNEIVPSFHQRIIYHVYDGIQTIKGYYTRAGVDRTL